MLYLVNVSQIHSRNELPYLLASVYASETVDAATLASLGIYRRYPTPRYTCATCSTLNTMSSQPVAVTAPHGKSTVKECKHYLQFLNMLAKHEFCKNNENISAATVAVNSIPPNKASS